LFSALNSLTIVAPSVWLAEHLKDSFLKENNIRVIHNGIDLSVFHPDVEYQALRQKYGLGNKSVILGVTKIWTKMKGLTDLLELNHSLRDDEQLILVGMNKQQLRTLPQGIIGIERTESVDELAGFYALADVYVNPTYLDNFPTTNLEALACGTPVITYKTGGSPEAINEKTGIVLEKGDIQGLRHSIDSLAENNREALRKRCADRAKDLFNKDDRFEDYISLYGSLNAIK
jgi:putative colanic acid biosynthesis glycosyltransferase WcaC